MVAPANSQNTSLPPIPIVSLARSDRPYFKSNPVQEQFTPYTPPVPRRITQAMLREYRKLQQEAAEADRLRLEHQKMLLAEMDAGADVEPGRLGVELVENELRCFSFEKVSRIAGEELAKQIRKQIDPSIQRYVRVIGQ